MVITDLPRTNGRSSEQFHPTASYRHHDLKLPKCWLPYFNVNLLVFSRFFCIEHTQGFKGLKSLKEIWSNFGRCTCLHLPKSWAKDTSKTFFYYETHGLFPQTWKFFSLLISSLNLNLIFFMIKREKCRAVNFFFQFRWKSN